jgi:hypothetical protein
MGLSFMQSLSTEQQALATISPDKARSNIQGEAFSDNKVIDFLGLQSSSMNEDQKSQLMKLVNQYISNTSEGHARVTMDEIREHIDNTYFAWIGKSDNDAVFYYRIHSPVI